MFETFMYIAILLIVIAMIGFTYRAIKGPTTPDRVVALDAIGISLAGLTALISIVLNTSAFLEVILVIGILAFIGTVAFSKFLEKGEVIENDRDS
ncbi:MULTISPECIES: Na(+)/H(+) antiporter subunit F1 [Bacillaceae]|uniref:Na(+)/H(+) antiporter subunit F1 n=2 Tax=Bacillales TaxID=1385 RepID=UPI001E562038|nr:MULTISPECIES: Na(+)/H(+) antiporter subunit F1 [Bacillaceae]MCE4050970.1 Na(+)/H(+) antiporter subunit F1 [Bacillus sp. Au-Bac7]MCM3033974.1 Na(+)/H(+) antiporter subunit F1 [Niallia sp. MER 6]UPO90075.1 Na(+)/H(+) antiporter subunit F1 [Niallia sp. Man26]